MTYVSEAIDPTNVEIEFDIVADAELILSKPTCQYG